MENKTKNNIMEKVRDDSVKMKSKWIFIAKSIGLKSGLGLTLVLLVLAINSFFYYIKSNNVLMSLHYGSSVWQQVLHSLPYDLILIIIIILLFLNYLIKKFDFSYSHPFVIIFSSIIIFVIMLSSLLFVSNFNNTMREGLINSDKNIPYVSDFYIHRCCHDDSCF